MGIFDCDADCVQSTLNIFGDKWTPLLVLQLSNGSKKFSELEVLLPGISPRTLSHRLEMLLSTKTIDKNTYQSQPVRHEYSLTQKGIDLQEVLVSMDTWGSKYGIDLLAKK